MWKEGELEHRADVPHAALMRREQEHYETPEAALFEVGPVKLMESVLNFRLQSFRRSLQTTRVILRPTTAFISTVTSWSGPYKFSWHGFCAHPQPLEFDEQHSTK